MAHNQTMIVNCSESLDELNTKLKACKKQFSELDKIFPYGSWDRKLQGFEKDHLPKNVLIEDTIKLKEKILTEMNELEKKIEQQKQTKKEYQSL